MHCNDVEGVEHLLLYGRHPAIIENVELLTGRHCQYIDVVNIKATNTK